MSRVTDKKNKRKRGQSSSSKPSIEYFDSLYEYEDRKIIKRPKPVNPTIVTAISDFKSKWIMSDGKELSLGDLISMVDILKEHEDECPDDFNIRKLTRPLPVLKEINKMIGMNTVKKSLGQLVLQECQPELSTSSGEMNNIIITGPPGCGKTTLSKKLANFFYKCGSVKNDKVTFLTRNDMIGKYLGHTAAKTFKSLEEAKDGVIVIDEAYSLGSGKEDHDSFSKEAVDTLNQWMSENTDTIIIIIGYKDNIEKDFFSINPGLSRRFSWNYAVDKYSPSELHQIFSKMVEDCGWKESPTAFDNDPTTFFNKNINSFTFFGGDIENFLKRCKVAHSVRVFGTDEKKKLLTSDDIKIGLQMFKEYRQSEVDNKITKFIEELKVNDILTANVNSFVPVQTIWQFYNHHSDRDVQKLRDFIKLMGDLGFPKLSYSEINGLRVRGYQGWNMDIQKGNRVFRNYCDNKLQEFLDLLTENSILTKKENSYLPVDDLWMCYKNEGDVELRSKSEFVRCLVDLNGFSEPLLKENRGIKVKCFLGWELKLSGPEGMFI